MPVHFQSVLLLIFASGGRKSTKTKWSFTVSVSMTAIPDMQYCSNVKEVQVVQLPKISLKNYFSKVNVKIKQLVPRGSHCRADVLMCPAEFNSLKHPSAVNFTKVNVKKKNLFPKGPHWRPDQYRPCFRVNTPCFGDVSQIIMVSRHFHLCG